MEKNLDCPCPNTGCERHGLCELCSAHHSGEVKPMCQRPKPEAES